MGARGRRGEGYKGESLMDQQAQYVIQEFKRRQRYRRILAFLLIAVGLLVFLFKSYFLHLINEYSRWGLLVYVGFMNFIIVVVVVLDRPNSMCPACHRHLGYVLGPIWSKAPKVCKHCNVRLR